MTENIDTSERDLERQKLAANSFVNQFSIERSQSFGALASEFFDGSRKIYSVAGYPAELSIGSYLGRYQRDSLAYRIITAAPDDTWRKPFQILDGSTLEDGDSETEFVNAWNEFIQFDTLDGDLLDESRRSLWHYFYEADRQCGIGRYSVMILGFNDGGKLNQPLKRNRGNKLIYITVMNEYDAKINLSDLVADPTSPRFGLPEFYQVAFGSGVGTIPVHFSRVIHIAENGVLFGKPRLEAIYNRLIDIEKLLSASAEAGWQAIARKIIITSREGHELAGGTITSDKVAAMNHDFQNTLELEGADATVISGESIDPSGAIGQQIAMVSAGTDIPVRILIGSERGSLASAQDEKHWNDNIQARRTSFIEPVIVRQFIKRMIYAGLLPMPVSGNYCLDWPSLYETDDVTQSQTFLTYAQGVTQLAGAGIERIVKPQEVVKYFVRGLPANALPTVEELAAMDEAAAQKQQDALALAKASQPQTQPTDGTQPAQDGQPVDKAATDKQPAVNSYSATEQQAIFEAAIRLVAGGA